MPDGGNGISVVELPAVELPALVACEEIPALWFRKEEQTPQHVKPEGADLSESVRR